METEDSNKLIAEFMGEQISKYGVVKIYNTSKCIQNPKGEVHLSMKYETSWDWLMPTVKKAVNLKIRDRIVGETAGIKFALGTANINNVYGAVVQFIKWYNKNI